MRTTEAAVKLVLGGNYDSAAAPSLVPFIDVATDVVDAVSAYATAEGSALSGTRLELIERWLTAHYYQISDPGYSSRSTGGTSGTFHGQTGKGYDATMYGQQAKLLDTSGYLAGLDAGQPSADCEWLGTTDADSQTWDERN